MKTHRPVIGIASMVLALAALPARAAPEPLGFDFSVTLSHKAAAYLSRHGESLVAVASYYGDPKPGADKYADEIGQIDLNPGDEFVEIPKPADSVVRIDGSTVSRKRLRWIEGPPKVNVNIVSGRKVFQDNLLACDFIDGPVHAVQEVAVNLHCWLISENPSTSLKP